MNPQHLGQPPAPLFDALDPPTQWMPVVEPAPRGEVAFPPDTPAEQRAQFVERFEAGEPNGNDLFDPLVLPAVDRRRPELHITPGWWVPLRHWSSEVLQVALGATLGCLLVLGALVLLSMTSR